MGIKVAEGYVEVSADTKKLDSDLNGIGGKSSGGLMSTGLKLGGALVGGLLAVDLAGKAKDWIGGAIMAGSDLNETMSKSTAIFGPQAAAIEAWAGTASTSLGLSKAAAMGSAASFGDMFSQIGFTGDEAAKMSTNVVQAAADLGSFSNLETADVAERISAAFRGEYDSLQAVIPNINAARVESEAMAATGKTTAASLTAQEKATAVMAIVTKDGARAMGDFGKTSEGFANQMKIASAQSEDLKAKVGTALQPALQAAAGVVTGSVMPALLGFADRAAPALETFFGSTLPGLAGTMGPALSPIISTVTGIGSSLAAGFAPFLAPLMNIGAQLGPVFAGLVTSVSPFSIVLAALAPVAGTLGNALGLVATTIATTLLSTLTTLQPMLSTLASTLSTGLAMILPVIAALLPPVAGLFSTLAAVISSILAAVLPLVSTLIGALVPALAQIIAAVLPVVSALVGLIGAAIVPLVNSIMGVLVPVIQALLPVITTVFGVIVSIVTAAMQIVQGIIQVVTGVITGNWSQVWAGIKNIVSGVWNAIKAVVTGAINIVKSVIQAGLSLVRSLFSSVWGGLKGIVSGAWNGITGAISSGVSSAVSFVSSLPGKIMSALSGLGSLLVGVGRNMMQGFIGGVQAVAGRIASAVLAPIRNSVEGVKNFLGIASPSRLMRDEVGAMMGEGTAIGVEATMPKVRASLVSGISSAVGAASGAASGAVSATLAVPVQETPAPAGRVSSSSGDTYVTVENVTIDASSIKEFSDLVDLFASMGQAARTGSARERRVPLG